MPMKTAGTVNQHVETVRRDVVCGGSECGDDKQYQCKGKHTYRCVAGGYRLLCGMRQTDGQ